MENTRWNKEGEKSESGQKKRRRERIEERADWKKNLEPWGGGEQIGCMADYGAKVQ